MKPVLKSFFLAVALTILFLFWGVQADSSIQVVVPDTSGEFGTNIAIPVIVDDVTTDDSVWSAEIILTFDSNVLTADSAYSTGTISQGWGAPTFNATIPGSLHIAMAGMSSVLSGSGVLVYAVFVVNGQLGDTTTIHFDQMMFNEGTPAVQTTDGLFKVGPGTDVREEDEILNRPDKLTLFQNYPNPFNPLTVIQYVLPYDCEVDISVYNVLGQKVKTLVKSKQEAGYQQVIWDGEDEKGEGVVSGIYFYKIKAGKFIQSKKMVIVK